MSRVRITARNGAGGVQAVTLTARNPKDAEHDRGVVGGASYQTRLSANVPPGPYRIGISWADGSEFQQDIEVGTMAFARTVTGPQLVAPDAETMDYKSGAGPRPEGFGGGGGEAEWIPSAGGLTGGGWSGRNLLIAAAAAALIAWQA
jgi:hypothetical protein